MPRPAYLRLSPFPIFLVFATILAIIVSLQNQRQVLSAFFIPPQVSATSQPAFLSSEFICHPCDGPMVHSASIVQDERKGLVAAWFGGTREGAGDVRIYQARLKAGQKRWTKEKVLLNRQMASQELHRYIKKLGNPVLGRSKDGKLWLFYVSVSAGGWSGSSVNFKVSSDEGKNWSTSRRLITSPFFNVSTLAHGIPLSRSNGDLLLPVYHELIGKFSELAEIGPDGRVIKFKRISHGRQSFQPVITVLGESKAVMLARSASPSSRHIFISRTNDAGKTWSTPEPTSLPNPDAGIAVAPGPGNSLLVVYNDSQSDRGNLALAISRDLGKTWKRIYYFEHEKTPGSGEEYSYPAIVRSGDRYHLVYTWRREGIRYVSFNSAWVASQEKAK